MENLLVVNCFSSPLAEYPLTLWASGYSANLIRQFLWNIVRLEEYVVTVSFFIHSKFCVGSDSCLCQLSILASTLEQSGIIWTGYVWSIETGLYCLSRSTVEATAKFLLLSLAKLPNSCRLLQPVASHAGCCCEWLRTINRFETFEWQNSF